MSKKSFSLQAREWRSRAAEAETLFLAAQCDEIAEAYENLSRVLRRNMPQVGAVARSGRARGPADTLEAGYAPF